MPEDWVVALQQAGLTEFFAGCTPSHRREYLKWIGEGKRPETRRSRIEQAMVMLAQCRSKEAATKAGAKRRLA